MKFENFSSIYPDQSGKLGKNEVILPNEERKGSLEEQIKEVKQKIEDISEEIMISTEEDSRVPKVFIEGKGFELEEARNELRILEQRLAEQKGGKGKLSRENLEAELRKQSARN